MTLDNIPVKMIDVLTDESEEIKVGVSLELRCVD